MASNNRTRELQKSMATKSMPSLPGCRPTGLVMNKHNKPQRFKVSQGHRIEYDSPPVISPALRVSPKSSLNEIYEQKQKLLKDWHSMEQALVLQRESQKVKTLLGEENKKNVMSLDRKPDWVKHDRDVLRFYMFFKEAVHESAVENHRVRKCTLYFYLSDKTIRIEEPKQANSGLPQGVFLKRMPLYRADGVTRYEPKDFLIGNENTLYNRCFRVVDMDEKTKAYIESQGLYPGEAEEFPEDPFTRRQRETEIAKNNKVDSIVGVKPADTLGKYLLNDNKTLVFKCLWDDSTSLYGEKNFYTLTYFLSDDSIEIAFQGNSQGTMRSKTLLKRNKLPKNMSDRDSDFYKAEDLICGEFIDCYSRNILILNCSTKFTRDYYQSEFGIDQVKVEMREEPAKICKREPAPYNGWGSEADSLANCVNLIAKPVKQDLYRFLNNRGKILRFSAEFVDPCAEDQGRRFGISYFMDDDTCEVFEIRQRNSGFMGGKFLERGRYKKPIKKIEKKDDQLKKLRQAIGDRLQAKQKDGPYELLRAFKRFGKTDTGNIDLENFIKGLRLIGLMPPLFDEETCAMLFDTCDDSGDGEISYEEFVYNIMDDKQQATNITHTSRWLRGSDFHVGAQIQFMFPQTGATTQKFRIAKANKATIQMMADHPEDFPQSNVEAIASLLSDALEEHKVNLKDAFRLIDTESKGWIHPSQFGEILEYWAKQYGIIADDLTDHETQTLVHHYDRDSDGKIYYNEFISAMRHQSSLRQDSRVESDQGAFNDASELLLKKLQKLCRDDLNMAFENLDLDGSGRISWDEFIEMLKSLGLGQDLSREDQMYLMLKFDMNQDGLIDYREFTDSLFDMERKAGRSTVTPKQKMQELNSHQEERAGDPRLVEYKAIVQSAQAKEGSRVALESLMRSFSSKFLRKKNLLIKNLRSFDSDNQGVVTQGEFLDALSRTNSNYSAKEKLTLALYACPTNSSVLNYNDFVETMLAQDISTALRVYGPLK